MSYVCICDLCGKPMTVWNRFNTYYKVEMRTEKEKRFHKLDVCQDCFKVIQKEIEKGKEE